jgi:hypothetical protein
MRVCRLIWWEYWDRLVRFLAVLRRNLTSRISGLVLTNEVPYSNPFGRGEEGSILLEDNDWSSGLRKRYLT